MSHYTPLRYPGGKSKLSPFVKAILKENRLLDGHYAEPFAGGAGVAIELLLTEHVSYIHLNDLNYPLFCFWWSVLNKCDELIAKIKRCKITVPAWKRHKNVIKNHDNHSKLDIGFSFFFLNRTNRSGILNGGVIGGYDQTGNWKIDARFNRENLIDRIQKIHSYKDRIKLYNMDACDFISLMKTSLPEKSFIYLDPPYYDKGQRLYDNFYVHSDHIEVRDSISEIRNIPWMVSYDYKPQIVDIYSAYPGYTYDLNYSAAKYYKGAEAVFFNPNVILPEDHPLMPNFYQVAS